jgi:signal transduction histidine kinase
MMRARLASVLALIGCCCAMWWTTAARAEQALDVAAELRGVPLGARVSLLEDVPGTLTIDDVVARAGAGFRAHTAETVSLGFSHSVYWLRIVVANSAPVKRSWLLEVAYPHLDDLTLYVPRADGGFAVRATGDSRPFSKRDLAYRNFVFMLDQAPGGPRVYYLRVQTVGSLSVPLIAWTLGEFVEHQHLDWAGLCIFYGVILAMACYTAGLYLFTRQREYLHFSAAVLAMGLFQLTYVGHAFQFLFPAHPALAQQSIVISVGLNMHFMANLAHHQLVSEASERIRRLHRAWMRIWIVLAVVAAFLPFALALRLMTVSCVLVNVVMTIIIVTRVRPRTRELRVYFLGWSCMCMGTVVLALKSAHILPENLFTNWSVQIGASAQFVLLASAMASKLTTLRSELGDLNGKLAHKVTALEQAVQRAEQASKLAERAARVKDAFIATMSHELRTPLNTIINVPEGLVEDFPVEQRACCSACQSEFELEPGERVDAGTRCPECQRPATLVLSERARYVGQPEKTVRYLEKIERSGTHLLHVIDGMLRADQTHSGEVPLAVEQVELTGLVREVVEEMSDLSARAGVKLELLGAPSTVALAVDPLRIRQVLINLVGNAIKFSSGRGTVRVRLAVEEHSCLCAVEDDGIGIASDKLETVFASYSQGDADVRRVYGGTGLGLSIARSLVQLHGGELWAESTLGKGSVFRFRLPRTDRVRASA